jgi:uncharacterized protein (TIGR00255 family)
MTGYAVESAELPVGSLSLELRSVNSRFLDLSFRMGEDFRLLEPQLRERIGEKVKRGKLECRVNFAPREAAGLPEAPNTALLDQLSRLEAAVIARASGATPLSVNEILRWPGMLGESRLDLETLHAAALRLADQALVDLNASRAREGDKLKAILLDRVAAIRRQTAGLAPRLPEIVAAYRDRLTRRLEEILAAPDQERVLQEVALYAQKIDVDEELGRLETHLVEVERVLAAGGAAGKRLDFLMQELNREANTLGSKSVSMELTQVSVELKVLIEQMREQVQNIE